MKHFRSIFLLLLLFSIANCVEKEGTIADYKNSQVVGFDASKCFCCWGWIIKVGSDTIKADIIPGLQMSEKIVFPIEARITVGTRKIDCSGNMADYYEILEFTEIK